ncbi:MAG: spermine/spermidine synthase domain-containing protein, partial [Planctomycetota bacterium]
ATRPTPRWNLFLTGFLVLFLELACIRWFAAYVIFLQFFTNIVLIACFLGMSIGCLCAKHTTDWLKRFPRLALWSVALAVLINALYAYWSGLAIDVGGQSSPEMVFFGTEQRNVDLAQFVIPVELLAGIFFVLITLMFVGPGQVLGRCLADYPDRVVAYTLNILGSLAGIAAFALVSFTGAPPVVWFAVGFVAVGYFLKQSGLLDRGQLFVLGGTTAMVALAGTSVRSNSQLFWSPYYMVEHIADARSIAVNQISHQTMGSWNEPPSVYSAVHLLQRDSGGRPFEDALIIGAGSGNDVAHALRHGVEHIDAVEIDPVIERLGRQYHPDRPYDDARVHLHLDDGRNFLRRTDREYDLVTYALVDSLILHSSYSSIRLESFLFTEEAFRDIRSVLKPGGVFVMYNFFRQGWIIERITAMLEQEFGKRPLIFSFPCTETIGPDDNLRGSITMILAGDTERISTAFERRGAFWLNSHADRNIAVNGFEVDPPAAAANGEAYKLAPANMVTSARPTVPASDDWPFLYLREPTLSWLYLRGMAIIGGLGLMLLLLLAPGRKVGFNGRMFFLGAGFLLLETKAVVHMALVFGSTWLVNSLVFFSILVMILAANLYVLKVRPVRTRWHYFGLFVCLTVNCVVPLDIFLAGNLLWKYVVPCLLVMLPMFFAGVIFAITFRESTHPNRDFGANIAGAVLGGLAEYTSMVLGFRYLLLVAIALYALSAAFRRGTSGVAVKSPLGRLSWPTATRAPTSVGG